MTSHERDADCIGHLVDGECQVCLCTGTDPCLVCGGLRYHEPDCASSDAGGEPEPDPRCVCHGAAHVATCPERVW